MPSEGDVRGGLLWATSLGHGRVNSTLSLAAYPTLTPSKNCAAMELLFEPKFPFKINVVPRGGVEHLSHFKGFHSLT
jgi:hypothetical protein